MSNDGGPTDPKNYIPQTSRNTADAIRPPLNNAINSERYAAYRTNIWNDDTLDESSKQRLQQVLDTSGVNGFDAELQNAKDGKGIYGVNKKNAELLNAMKDRPGRSQTILTQGVSSITGEAPTGILTNFQNNAQGGKR